MSDPHGNQPALTHGPELSEAGGVLIAVHGRGGSAQGILDLARAVAPDGWHLVAPSAAGGTWYPYSFMAPTPSNEPGITSGVAAIHRHIDAALEAGIGAERVALIGFSQGACLALESAFRKGEAIAGIFGLSGGLIGPPGTEWRTDRRFDRTTVFLGCSDVDAHIPLARVHETSDVFRRAGADVTERIYPGMGHLVNEDEVDFVRGHLAGLSGQA